MSTSTAGVDGLDSILKLWIRLWSLILDKKRHYETVRALLQRLVYESGWPAHKNWPAICELGRHDKFMMMVLALLDISKTDDPTVQNIIAAFPDYFSDIEVKGAIPLSAILEQAGPEPNERDEHPRTYPWTHEVLSHFNLPTTCLLKKGYRPFGRFQEELSVLPDSIPEDTPQWSVVKYTGHDFIVAENAVDARGEMVLVPANCIVLGL